MVLQLVNVVYVLVAIAMIALILMQRGSGAAAGSGFGAGASGTVFGARGASNFLSKSTKWLAVVFCVFATLAVSSLFSGVLVTTQGWTLLNYGSLAPIAITGAALLWLALHRRRVQAA